MQDEQVIYQTCLHWILFFWPVIWTVFIFIFFKLSYYQEYKSAEDYITFIKVLFIFFAFCSWLSAIISLKTSEFGVTNKRVIIKTGFIRRKSLELLLSKIESIEIEQSIAGRILNFGSLIIIGTGGTQHLFHKISRPFIFRKHAQEQIEAY
jgi:uncharacterized membrane protein YdbT with pleckstrin-like domain